MVDRPPSTREVWTSDERTEILRRNAERNAAASAEEARVLLDSAGLAPGQTVLDLACGPGDPTLDAAARVGPTGRVVGCDLSEGALEVARERAGRAGLTNVEFRVATAEALPFGAGSFDRYLCRFGMMFFEELDRACAEARRVLRPDGRLAAMVWGPWRQPYFLATVGVVMEAAGLRELSALQKVPFRFAEPGPLETALVEAGFADVRAETRTVDWIFRGTPEEARDQWWASTVLWRPLVDSLPPFERPSVRAEVASRLKPFYDGVVLRVPETVRVVTATGR